MSYSVNPAVWGNMFGLPADVADKHLKMANEAQIKSILWIFRNINAQIEPKVIAKAIGKPVPAVEEALRYWVSVGVLNSEILSFESKNEVNITPVKELPVIPEAKPTYEQIKIRCKEAPELAALLKEVQVILGKTMGYEGECTILMMHDHYGLPSEVIYMLVNYCVEIGKSSYAYMSKVAKNWGEREIDTFEKAEDIISNLNLCQSIWEKFTRLTGIQNPKPTAKQSQHLLTWVKEYKFSVDMIYCAYEIMIDNCAKINFKYMDAILKDWFQKSFKNPQDIQQEKKHSVASAAKPKSKASSAHSSDSSYDMEEFKRRANQLPIYNKGENQ